MESKHLTGRQRIVATTLVVVTLATALVSCRRAAPAAFTPSTTPGVEYTNQRIESVPWSVHVVRFDRADPAFSVRSSHAFGRALGLSPLSQILRQVPPEAGTPVAAVNGDFYQRDRAYAGDPRGLQIVEGDLFSAPIGGVAFWVDAAGQFNAAAISNQFRATGPDGFSETFGLNEERRPDRAVLYTPSLGDSTKTSGGRELVLEPTDTKGWPPLAVDAELVARIREVRDGGNSPLKPGTLVLSLGPALAKKAPALAAGAELKLSTTTQPSLRSANSAISGGPLLVHQGQRLKIQAPRTDSYEFSSMFERHPRSAVGWNATHGFLVQVDGRQKGLSVGMTLEELGKYMADLGCTEAMNLDGGGSATFWFEGAIRNSPCDGGERPIANGLVVVRRTNAAPAAAANR